MDNIKRLQYLEAMGIDVWVPRTPNENHQALAKTGVDPTNDSWDALKAEVAQCSQCGLCEIRSQSVFGAGNKNADWMIIGEAPGQSEDKQGLPFVGNAGSLLTEMLRAINLTREEVFITNIVKCRPPDNRKPKVLEVETCKTFLLRQLVLIKPKIILIFGHVASQGLLNTAETIDELRGKIHTLNGIQVVVTYHPAYLLRLLSDKRKAWADLKFALQTYKKIKGRSCGE